MIVFSAILAYLHYIAIMLLAALAAMQFLLLRQDLHVRNINALERVDFAHVSCGVLALLSGGLRFGTSVKGIVFYAGSVTFWLKILLFGALALASFLVSRHYGRWIHHARTDTAYHAPAAEAASALLMVKFQLMLLAILPLLAALMAREITF